jgi:hypothetical protein
MGKATVPLFRGIHPRPLGPPIVLFAIVSAVSRSAMLSHFRDRYREFGSALRRNHSVCANILNVINLSRSRDQFNDSFTSQTRRRREERRWKLGGISLDQFALSLYFCPSTAIL